MNSLIIRLKNCYGIKAFDAHFNFSISHVHSLYAPNGSMKTSFSRTFQDYSRNEISKDAVFPDRNTERIIEDESGHEIEKESVFVIEPYNKDFNSEKTSLLLVNPSIKSEYDAALVAIDQKKTEIFKQLKQLSGLTSRTITPETVINKVFGTKSFFELIENIPEYSSNIPIDKLGQVVYSRLFSDKTVAFLESESVKKQIKEYIDKYDELITKSPILNKTFNHSQANGIHKNLADSGFFSAKHSIGLFNGTNREEYTSSEELEKRIKDEKEKIITNKDLEKKFDAIDKKLSNTELRSLRDYLYDNQELLVEFDNINKLQQNIFLSYFYKTGDSLQELISTYETNKNILENAINKAKEEKTQWEEVVLNFKRRFSVPFEVTIDNQEDVILKDIAPRLTFTFIDGAEKKNIDSVSLVNVLSQGEKRALYLMNILFELNARIKSNIKSLLIIDDIADSFDYKNKYAIIEYLREITENPIFNTIFLTHNFDFHRTVCSRLNVRRNSRYLIYKNDDCIILKEEYYQKNPFEYWKDNLDNERYLIASIPFIRNLADYCGHSNVYSVLTSTLHIKPTTYSIKIKDIENAIKTVLTDKQSISLPNSDKLYIDVLQSNIEAILTETNETTELESKIILSIGIRYFAESFMIREIANTTFVESIQKNQTIELFKKYISVQPTEIEKIQLLDEVNIMTPESIHLNSFMYEPILDMSPVNLKMLYTRIKTELA